MKKLLMILAIALAVLVSFSAVSADDEWSFNWSSSSSSNTDGGQLNVVNNEVNIQGFKFVIPDGYTHNESADEIGKEAGENFPDCKKSTVIFDNGNDSIIIKVVYGADFNSDTYTPSNSSVEKQIENQKGFFKENDEGVTFDYCKDSKLVEINAPNPETLNSVLQSAK